MNDELEWPACPLCQARAERRVLSLTPPYTLVRCEVCRLYYLSPRLREEVLNARYQRGDYYVSQTPGWGYVDYLAQEEALRRTFRRFLRGWSRAGRGGGKLLEVGCGYGFFLDEARDHFRRREGTEYDPLAIERAAQVADAIHEGGVGEIPASERYDLIFSSQVIEHVYDPLPFLTGLREHLAPGGQLVLTTPDMGAAYRRVLGARWPSFKVPEHVTYFDRKTLTELLRRAGYGQVERVSFPHAFPVSVVARKLRLRVPEVLATRSMWFPGVILALTARV